MAIKILSVNEGDVSDGLIGNIFASVAEWESEVIGQRTKDAMRQKFREGWWPGWAPYGYINTQKGDKRIVVPDPILAPLIKQLYELYATGSYSLLELARVMFAKGLKSRNGKIISDSSLQKILTNKFYYGVMTWGGDEKLGNHEPIVSKTLFDQCQYVAAQHRNFLIRKRKWSYLLRGFAYCGVHETRLTAEGKHINSKKNPKISYYRCTNQGGCSQSYIRADLLEKQVGKLFKRFEFSPDFIELVHDKAKDYFEENRGSIQSEKQGLINKRKALEEKRNKLEDLIVDGTISRDVFKRQHEQLEADISQLDDNIKDLEAKKNLDVKLIDEILALTRNIYQTYLDAPDFLKRHYLRLFFEAIFIKDHEIAKVSETPLFSELRRQNSCRIRLQMLPR
ncbi:hypothetical protein A3D00_03170 [Candidatus Woesebacteria bacterium RIFCSPHIGHO2_02_FULL_38_9]|uniref:Recombinase domain-containing protein n=1 Tax=Candidatus Woesebacteria bacterium RIFCSPHIGHO2_01_FULL_39_28 TaxID=1802496 RepID=A0A1F7YHT8_9BACT|nr:MAG: hypothetical protein A2627_05615 [Candidatus Woesebacteria bacterium RIFCSPHIGHO2_01_FULL_39_28]OGM31472.1 MAG: hypothetical protein A3D00_03170 [Candidatus Woesebacteria bacterium RIFCSPHIGHO2_02_FULL_38_9]OGM56656.1 MAG: hypothetical protein A3A50_04810 [Candidatus Woesebacteria bacterium RIFCSPLOWO2_01_FULL_38_20]